MDSIIREYYRESIGVIIINFLSSFYFLFIVSTVEASGVGILSRLSVFRLTDVNYTIRYEFVSKLRPD